MAGQTNVARNPAGGIPFSNYRAEPVSQAADDSLQRPPSIVREPEDGGALRHPSQCGRCARHLVYCGLLLKASPLRIVVTAGAVIAVFGLSLLPAEHLHASPSGTAVVHRHVVDDPSEHPEATLHHDDHAPVTTLDHDAHSSVTTVDSAFNAQRQYSVARPLIPAGLLDIARDRRFSGRVDRLDVPRSHGPPIRVRSLRAPPA